MLRASNSPPLFPLLNPPFHDLVFMSNVDQKSKRYATFVDLTKTQADSPVAEVRHVIPRRLMFCLFITDFHQVVHEIRQSNILQRHFLRKQAVDIPRFDIHWLIREVIKTVLYNQK